MLSADAIRRRRLTTASIALLAASIVGACSKAELDIEVHPADCQESPGELFERRIRPLLETDRPESCTECHARGISLAAFARDDVCESMACLVADGLVNLEQPEASVLLSWIDRAGGTGPLVTERMVLEEYTGFLEWIQHEAECGSCKKKKCGADAEPLCDAVDQEERSLAPDTDPLDCERETLEALFRGTIYKDRDRCIPCHFMEEDTAVSEAPRFFTERGGCGVGSLASMNAIVGRGLINTRHPELSLLLLKPLAESDGGAVHEGGDKFLKEDDDHYDSFLYFATRYAECQARAADPD